MVLFYIYIYFGFFMSVRCISILSFFVFFFFYMNCFQLVCFTHRDVMSWRDVIRHGVMSYVMA